MLRSSPISIQQIMAVAETHVSLLPQMEIEEEH
jgi:hypothetical protein